MSTLHCIRSLAACWASPHDRFIGSSSCVTQMCARCFGLPGFLLPWWRPSQGTWPSPSQASTWVVRCAGHCWRSYLAESCGIAVDCIHYGTLPFSSCLFRQPRQLSEPYSTVIHKYILYIYIHTNMHTYTYIHIPPQVHDRKRFFHGCIFFQILLFSAPSPPNPHTSLTAAFSNASPHCLSLSLSPLQ